jgi:hypothetical protein
MGGGAFSPAWRLPMVETDVEAVRCSSRCSGISMGTQGSFVVWRWKQRELRRACPWWPGVSGERWRGEVVTRPSETGENGLGQCAMERKERSRDSPEVVNFVRRAVVVLLTTSGEMLKCGRLTMTLAMRLGGEAPGRYCASIEPLGGCSGAA